LAKLLRIRFFSVNEYAMSVLSAQSENLLCAGFVFARKLRAAERFQAEKSAKDRAGCIPLDPSLPLLQQRRRAARSLCCQFAVPAESGFTFGRLTT
jgi:hypothetical protein